MSREKQPLRVVSLPGASQGKDTFIPLGLIDDNPIPARRAYPKSLIDQRAEEILRDGLLDPIKVRPNPEMPGRFFLIDGKTRLEAYRQHKIALEIQAVVRNVDEIVAAIQGFAANHDRDNGCDLDDAYFIQEMLDRTGRTQEELARELGVSQTRISLLQAFFKLTTESIDTILSSSNPKLATYNNISLIISATKNKQEQELVLVKGLVTEGWSRTKLKAKIAECVTNPETSGARKRAQDEVIELAKGVTLKQRAKTVEISGLDDGKRRLLLEKIREWLES